MHTTKVILSIFIIAALIIGAGIFGANTLKSTSKKIETHILKVEGNTTSGNWTLAQENLENIEKDWSKAEGLWTILLDHVEIDNIDNSLSRMKKYVESKDKSLALGEIANLKQYIKHIPQKDSVNLRNIF